MLPFVPSYSSELVRGKNKAKNFANDAFNYLMLGLLILVYSYCNFSADHLLLCFTGFTQGSGSKIELTYITDNVLHFQVLTLCRFGLFFSQP